MFSMSEKRNWYADGARDYIFLIGKWFRMECCSFPEWDEFSLYFWQKFQIYAYRNKEAFNNILTFKFAICKDSFSFILMILWFELEISFDKEFYYDV